MAPRNRICATSTRVCKQSTICAKTVPKAWRFSVLARFHRHRAEIRRGIAASDKVSA